MKIFKIIEEIKTFRLYKNIVKEISTKEIFKRYDFSYGWIGQMGTIIRIDNSLIKTGNTEIDKNMIEEYLLDYYSAFFDFLKKVGITNDMVKFEIEELTKNELIGIDLDKYTFRKIKISYFWKNFNFQYLLKRFLFLVLLIGLSRTLVTLVMR